MKTLLTITLLCSTLLFAGKSNKPGVAPVTYQLYIDECGSCHFAYQPGLLPQRSWNKLMANLQDHFGTDATLDEPEYTSIRRYLVANAADKAHQFKRSRKIDKKIYHYETPLAVTKTRYFIRKHDEIPKYLITQKEVRSLSNCIACHTTADKGIYSERAIKIPNYGGWDDD